MRVIYFKCALVIVVVLISILSLIPSFYPSAWPYNKINLGLDLQGGTHLMLKVDVKQVIKNFTDTLSKDIDFFLKSNLIKNSNMKVSSKNIISFELENIENFNVFKDILYEEFNFISISSLNFNERNINKNRINIEIKDSKIQEISKYSMNQAIETIRNRIDEFGVTEPDIRTYGSDCILVQLPGIKDVQRAKDIIGRMAILEFRIVEDKINIEKIIKNNIIPSDCEIKYRKVSNRMIDGEKDKIPILVKKYAPITGSHLLDARVSINLRSNIPNVKIRLNKIGSKIFEEITAKNLNKYLAIVLDNNVYCTPIISEKISGGEAVINGRFTDKEAIDLAIILRAGSLPAPVKIIEERTVGPSLGEDSIKAGLFSMYIGSALVVLFMIIYYKLVGLIANLSLIVNILMVSAILAFFEATLTLPGISGIILTVGIAVDSSVLIFERIRDEIEVGKSQITSLISGFNKASVTIFDANVTTLIASLVLFKFGTGPIKGFALTLSIGVISSLFTSLFVTRTILDYIIRYWKYDIKF